MKTIFIYFIFVLIALHEIADASTGTQFKLVGTCSNPILVEGELYIYMNSSKSAAKISFGNLTEVATSVVKTDDLGLILEYTDQVATRRLNFDQSNNYRLQSMNPDTGLFEQSGKLHCVRR